MSDVCHLYFISQELILFQSGYETYVIINVNLIYLKYFNLLCYLSFMLVWISKFPMNHY
jgi:hypothetical protein